MMDHHGVNRSAELSFGSVLIFVNFQVLKYSITYIYISV
jgi:hypothetical protein